MAWGIEVESVVSLLLEKHCCELSCPPTVLRTDCQESVRTATTYLPERNAWGIVG